MTGTIISLNASMKRRLPFDHEFMDEIGKGFYDLTKKQVREVLVRYIKTRTDDDKYILTMSHMWLVRDFVCRYRAHFPETHQMTDDLVSVGMEAVSEFFSTVDTAENMFENLQSLIHTRTKCYINDNRSAFCSSIATNWRRQRAESPLEYNFASEFNDDLVGTESNEPYLIDVLDAIEQLNEVDAEEMRDLVYQFLQQNHNISEDQLTPEEKAGLEKLTEFVRNAGL